MNEFREVLDWRIRLHDARVARGVSFAELARRTGLSVSVLKAYEGGRRHPSPAALNEIIAAIGLAHEEGNPIRAGAGFAIDFSALFDQRYIFDIEVAQQQLDTLSWPAYITNQATLVVAFNRPFAALLDVEPEIDFPIQPSAISWPTRTNHASQAASRISTRSSACSLVSPRATRV